MSKILIGIALVATLIAVYFAPSEDDVVAPASTRTATGAGTGAALGANTATGTGGTGGTGQQRVARIDLHILPRDEQDMGNLFDSESMVAKEIQSAFSNVRKVPQKPEPPQAPPLPFRFMGRFIDGGEVAYFLQLNNNNIVMRVGDSINNTYTLEDASAGSLRFVYLPLKQKQSLVVGEVN
jgi:hypothetical protein